MEKKRLTPEERRAIREKALEKYEEHYSQFTDDEFIEQLRAYGMEVEKGEGKITFVESVESHMQETMSEPVLLQTHGKVQHYRTNPKQSGHEVQSIGSTLFRASFTGRIHRVFLPHERKGEIGK